MTLQLRLILGIGVIFYIAIIMRLIGKKILLLKYALLWFAVGIIMAVLVLFPELLSFLVSILGIQLPVNGLFLFGIIASFVIIMSLTAIVSHQSERIKSLAQSNAILEKRIRNLEVYYTTKEGLQEKMQDDEMFM